MVDVYDVTLTFDKPLSTFSHLFFLRSNIQEDILEIQESIFKEILVLRRAERLLVSCTEAEERTRHEHALDLCPQRISILNARKDLLTNLLSICDGRLEKFRTAGIDSDSCITALKEQVEIIDERLIQSITNKTTGIE